MGSATIERAGAKDVERASTSLSIPADVRLIVGPVDFAKLCVANPILQLEREADGGLIVMAPASPDGGGRELQLSVELELWNRTAKLGKAFSPSSGFTFPDGSVRAPDASWMRNEVWAAVDGDERLKLSRVVPDFAAEIRSPSNTLADLRAKMAAYIANGVRLAWLIDPLTRTAEIHRPGRDVETLAAPGTLSGEDVLPGFVLDLARIFED